MARPPEAATTIQYGRASGHPTHINGEPTEGPAE